jgi:hypothetical protein
MKNVLKIRSMRQLLVVPAAALLVSGCGGLAQDYCEAMCECEICNDRQAEDCEISAGEILDVAEAYECSGPAEDYYNCTIDSSECEDNNWQLVQESQEVCLELQAQIYQCIADHSAILEGTPPPPPDNG